MGVVPDARGSGAAGFLLAHLLGEAKSRTDEAMGLEVFEQNLPALTLYRQNKFRELTRLFGWRRPAGKIETQFEQDIEKISLLAASRIRGPLDLDMMPPNCSSRSRDDRQIRNRVWMNPVADAKSRRRIGCSSKPSGDWATRTRRIF